MQVLEEIARRIFFKSTLNVDSSTGIWTWKEELGYLSLSLSLSLFLLSLSASSLWK